MNAHLEELMKKYEERKLHGGDCDAACDISPNTYHRAKCAGAKFYCAKHDVHFDANREEIAPNKIFYTKHPKPGCLHRNV